MAITEEQYLQLSQRNSIFIDIGMQHFEPKIWLIFVALKNKQVSLESVASNPCQSLMKHNIAYDQIGEFLEELRKSGVFHRDSANVYRLRPELAYELHRVCYEIATKIDELQIPLKQILIECGYKSTPETNDKIRKFNNGDDNLKSEILKELLAQIAYAGANLLLKGLLRLNEKIDQQ